VLKLLKYISAVYNKPNSWLAFYLRQFFYFIRQNIVNLLRKRIIFQTFPTIKQFTLCEASGAVEIGRDCVFGYKMDGFHTGSSIEMQARYKNAIIKIRNNIATNNNIFICAANYIEIGDDLLTGQNVITVDHEAHGNKPDERRQLGEIGKVIIGKNVWVGNNVTILKNSKIGDNSIVATGAVVIGKFPVNVIIGGIPANFIKAV